MQSDLVRPKSATLVFVKERNWFQQEDDCQHQQPLCQHELGQFERLRPKPCRRANGNVGDDTGKESIQIYSICPSGLVHHPLAQAYFLTDFR